MKQFLLALARHKTATILIVLALVVSTTVLVAQQPSRTAAPAESGIGNYYSSSDYQSAMDTFIHKERKHSKSAQLSDETVSYDCTNSACKTFLFSFVSAANTALIPDQVVFVDKKTREPIGGLDYRDFTIGKHTTIQLPIGQYLMIARHHMYQDLVFDYDITQENVSEVGYEHNISMTLKQTVESPIKILPDANSVHLFGTVRDVSTGLPVGGVRVSVGNYYQNYTGDRNIYAVTDQFGVFYSENGISFPDESNKPDIISEFSGKEGYHLQLNYSKSGFEQTNQEYSILTPATDESYYPAIGQGNLKPNGRELVDYPTTELKKLRKIKNPAEFFDIIKSVTSCTMPTSIKVGVSCTGCGNNTCTVYSYNGSPTLSFERYAKTVLYNEWYSSWGNTSDGMNSLNAGIVAIRTVGAYFIANPVGGSNYHIGGTTCWQAFDGGTYNSFSSNSFCPNVQSTSSNTSGYILRNGSSFPKSEYARETNNLASCGNGCGDGKFQKADQGITGGCYPATGVDYVSLGKSWCGTGSHPRGMSQRSSMRWASGLEVGSNGALSGVIIPTMYNNIAYCKKTWQQILAHYYPYYTLENCSTGSTLALSGVSQVCGVNLTHNNPTFTRTNRTFNLTCKVKNNGGTSSGQFYSRFYLSTNATYSSNDILIGNFTTSSTTSGSAATGTLSTTVSATTAPAGTYYLIFVVDATNTINETSEATSDNVYVFPTPFTLGTSFAAENLTDGETETQTVSDESLLDVLNVELSSDHCSVQTRDRTITVSCDDAVQCRIYDIQGMSLNVTEIDKQNYQCTVPTTGVYLVVSIDADGHRHVYKVMIFD